MDLAEFATWYSRTCALIARAKRAKLAKLDAESKAKDGAAREKAQRIEKATAALDPKLLALAEAKFVELDSDWSGTLSGDELVACADWVISVFFKEEDVDAEQRAEMAQTVLREVDEDGDGVSPSTLPPPTHPLPCRHGDTMLTKSALLVYLVACINLQ